MGEIVILILRKIADALINSSKGLSAVWKYQLSFRIITFISLLATPVAFYIGKTTTQKALLIASLMLVLITEVINSAIEAVVDRISLDRHELSGRAKDIASAATFLAVINACIVWLFIFFSKMP